MVRGEGHAKTQNKTISYVQYYMNIKLNCTNTLCTGHVCSRKLDIQMLLDKRVFS